MYGRELIITGDRRKLSFFARGNANRFQVVHAGGALGEVSSIECAPGFRRAPNGQCITEQSAGGHGSDLTDLFDDSRLKCPGGFLDPDTGRCMKVGFTPDALAKLATMGQQSVTNLVPGKSVGFTELLPTLGLVGGGIGVVYGLMKKKPGVAIVAGLAGLVAVVLPGLVGSKNPFAGIHDDSVYK